jgi:hypothetical protein
MTDEGSSSTAKPNAHEDTEAPTPPTSPGLCDEQIELWRLVTDLDEEFWQTVDRAHVYSLADIMQYARPASQTCAFCLSCLKHGPYAHSTSDAWKLAEEQGWIPLDDGLWCQQCGRMKQLGLWKPPSEEMRDHMRTTINEIRKLRQARTSQPVRSWLLFVFLGVLILIICMLIKVGLQILLGGH